jgi:hypothetical protein
MLALRLVASIFPVVVIALGQRVVCGRSYPNKPIRLLTAGAGGATTFQRA